MLRTQLAIAIAAGLIAALPAQAQPSRPAARQDTQEIAPQQLTATQIKALQQKLNEQGFDAGVVDGLWGPNTEAALRRFQQKHAMQATGHLDQGIVTALGLTGVLASPSTPPAPVAATAPTPATVPPTVPVDPTGTTLPTPARTEATTAPPPATGNGNPPVATTSANAPQPAHGANSFTQGEAQGRIERNGFQDVSALHLDTDVWRGTATKDGHPVQVWLDYKGNVGQQ